MSTYYIDYNATDDSANGTSIETPWKRCPGMTGFAGTYVHAAGDVFIFKGGVTWPYLGMTITNDGDADHIDTYTASESWYTGESWAQPIFDGDGAMTTGQSLITLADPTEYVKIDNIKFQNTGTSGNTSDTRCIFGYLRNGVEISYCTFVPYANHAIILVYQGNAAVTSGVKIHHNSISHATNNIEIGTDNAGEATEDITGIEIYNNDVFDPGSQLVDADHGDGIHIFSVYGTGNVKASKIYNNRIYGNWAGADAVTSSTAQIYIENACDGMIIYNNALTVSNNTHGSSGYCISPGQICIAGCLNVEVYNNSISAGAMTTPSGNDGISAGVYVTNGDNTSSVTIKNNIIKGQRILINIMSGTLTASDYNQYNIRAGGDVGYISGSFLSFAQWQGLGHDAHGAAGDPLFISDSNLSITSLSPCIDHGSDLTATGITTDILGEDRPIGAAWDIGAYEYDSVTPAKLVMVLK